MLASGLYGVTTTPSSFQKEVKPAGTGFSHTVYRPGRRLGHSRIPSTSPKVDRMMPPAGSPGPVRTNAMPLLGSTMPFDESGTGVDASLFTAKVGDLI